MVGGVFVRGIGLALGWEAAIEKIAREEILPFLGPVRVFPVRFRIFQSTYGGISTRNETTK